MLAGLRKIAAWLARHWGFPANFQWWWLLLGLPSVPAVVGGIITFIQNASWLVILLVVLGSYIVALGATAVILRRLLPNTSVATPDTGTTESTHAETYRSPQQSQHETYETYLRRRCRVLAQELFRFLDEQGYSRFEDPDDPEIERRDDKALAIYNRSSLGPDVKNLLRKLKERSLYRPETLASFEQRSIDNPLSLHAIERIANLLNEIGHDW